MWVEVMIVYIFSFSEFDFDGCFQQNKGAPSHSFLFDYRLECCFVLILLNGTQKG